jgi:hypothetical protein
LTSAASAEPAAPPAAPRRPCPSSSSPAQLKQPPRNGRGEGEEGDGTEGGRKGTEIKEGGRRGSGGGSFGFSLLPRRGGRALSSLTHGERGRGGEAGRWRRKPKKAHGGERANELRAVKHKPRKKRQRRTDASAPLISSLACLVCF